jgi:predicted Holliday junction resolvase-like endonuclease
MTAPKRNWRVEESERSYDVQRRLREDYYRRERQRKLKAKIKARAREIRERDPEPPGDVFHHADGSTR